MIDRLIEIIPIDFLLGFPDAFPLKGRFLGKAPQQLNILSKFLTKHFQDLVQVIVMTGGSFAGVSKPDISGAKAKTRLAKFFEITTRMRVRFENYGTVENVYTFADFDKAALIINEQSKTATIPLDALTRRMAAFRPVGPMDYPTLAEFNSIISDTRTWLDEKLEGSGRVQAALFKSFTAEFISMAERTWRILFDPTHPLCDDLTNQQFIKTCFYFFSVFTDFEKSRPEAYKSFRKVYVFQQTRDGRCAKCSHAAKSKCSKCQIFRYCSPACQKEDWKEHKLICGKETFEEVEAELLKGPFWLREDI